MWVNWSVTSVVSDTGNSGAHPYLSAPSGLASIVMPQGWYVAVADQAEGALSCYAVNADGSLSLASTRQKSALNAVSMLETATTEDGTYLITGSNWAESGAGFRVFGGGKITGAGAGDDWTARVTAASFDSGTLFLSTRDAAGITAVDLSLNGDFTKITQIGTTAKIGALSAITTASAKIVFAATPDANGIQSFRLRDNGELVNRHDFETGPELPLNTPTELVTAQTASGQFLIVASSGTDSLFVFRIKHLGGLVAVDEVMDTMDTRFRDVSRLDIHEVGGRILVTATGSDDGLSLFELGQDGHLAHLLSLEDTYDTTLSGISGIEINETGGNIFMVVAGQSDGGLTVISLDLPALATSQTGTHLPETLLGGDGADYLNGKGGRDILSGGAGDDHLVDGKARDTLTGGEGADRFEMTPDGVKDTITDFSRGEDLIDLSNYDNLYSIDQLSIQAFDTGAKIWIGEELLKVYSADGSSLSGLDSSDFTFV